VYLYSAALYELILVSCRILEHFARLPDPVNEFLKLGSALHSKAPYWHQKYADLPSTVRRHYGTENKQNSLPPARPHFGARKIWIQ